MSLGLVTGAAGANALDATSQPANALSLAAVGQTGGYFEVIAGPGQAVQLTVARANTGNGPIDVRTYPANAYSIINGGFGAKTRDNTASGTAEWLSYKDEVITLGAGVVSTVSFIVTVPSGTAPGDYLSGVVLENDVPVVGSGTIALDQIYRHVLAVSIRVPGPYTPIFGLASPEHSYNGANSVVGATIDNTGNQNLRPAGNLVVKDGSGAVVSDAPLTMGSLYAHDETKVQATLGGQLDPGEYTLSVMLVDSGTGASAELIDAPFTVVRPDAGNSSGPLGALPEIFQSPGGGPSVWFWVLVTVLLTALSAGIYFVRRRVLVKRATKTDETVSDARAAKEQPLAAPAVGEE